MYGGRIHFTTPMLWSVGFIVTFVIGGMTGVLLAVPPADFQVHESMFLIAHFHNVIIGGVLFGAFADMTYWFPKAFGFRLHEGWGKAAFWFAFIGFYVTFMPLYVAGLLGMTRRLQHYDFDLWRPWMLIALCGVIILFVGAVSQIMQLIVSIRHRDELRDVTGDPWNGRSLEWATASPPPAFNFAVLPNVLGGGALFGTSSARRLRPSNCPRNLYTSQSICRGTARPASSRRSSQRSPDLLSSGTFGGWPVSAWLPLTPSSFGALGATLWNRSTGRGSRFGRPARRRVRQQWLEENAREGATV